MGDAKKKQRKRKGVIYCIVFVGQIVTILLISQITGIDTANTWLGSVGMSVIFITLSVLLIDIRKAIKHTHRRVTFLLDVLIFVIAISVIISNVRSFLM